MSQSPFLPIFKSIGLTTEEAEIYQSLLEGGAQSAAGLAKTTKVKRTYIYKVASQLETRGLITKSLQGKTTFFTPQPPDQLQLQAYNQQKQAQTAISTLSAILPQLKSLYLLQQNKPVITFFEGVAGIEKIYDDIVSTRQDIILFRSVFDHETKELNDVIERQINHQIAAGIHCRVITPYEPIYTRYTYMTLDHSRLVERHITQKYDLPLHSQIIIYGQKIAIMSLRTSYLGIIIDNPDIAQTLSTIFEFMWQATKEEHQQITSSWNSPGPNPYLKPIKPFKQRS